MHIVIKHGSQISTHEYTILRENRSIPRTDAPPTSVLSLSHLPASLPEVISILSFVSLVPLLFKFFKISLLYPILKVF